MRQRKLSRQLAVSEQGLGCMGMSAFYGPRDEAESIATVHRAIDAGVTLIDTADMYAAGANEELVGKALKGRRDRVILATKFGQTWGPDKKPSGINGRPEYVRQACDDSLKRLGVDHIDIYFQHRVDASVPVDETFGAMAELVSRGKVRFLGICEAAPATIEKAHATHPLVAVQTEYSLWSREPEQDVIPTCRRLGIGYIAYSPLGRGFLTGAIKKPEDLAADDIRRIMPRFQGESFAKNIALVEAVERKAKAKGCTPAQLALAWVLAKGADIVPIPGTKRRQYLDQNMAASDITLTPGEVAEIEAAFPLDAAVGTRYPAAAMAALNR
jgi:aryl-alcohol dehydrogenase-like predicted oxidoreductase